jgi:hypothetical protein
LNYKKIYDDFIADRLKHPKDGYQEIHHIVPRCLGGSDDKANKIRLIPEEHFFAHLLLAKAYNIPALWSAVMVMHARGDRRGIFTRRSRSAYAWARRQYGIACKTRTGPTNPNYNPEILALNHKSGATIIGTRNQIIQARLGIDHAKLSSILAGNSKSSNEWMLPETNPAQIGQYKGMNGDKTLYSWKHLDGRTFIGTRSELAHEFNLRSTDISGVVNGEHSHCLGWHLSDNPKIGWGNGRLLGKDTTTYEIRHPDGRAARGTRKELEEALELSQQRVSEIINRKPTPKTRSWYRVSYMP